jgi:hypothetical protein
MDAAMRAIKGHLSKLLAGAVVGAVLGVLIGGFVVGYSWGASAIIGACIFAALSALYGPSTFHSEPTSKGTTYPCNRDGYTP